MQLPGNMEQIKRAFRTAIASFLNSKLAFALTIILAALTTLLRQPEFLIPAAEALKQHPFASGVLQSSLAAIIFTWAAYLWRVEIRRIIQTETTSIRAPLQLAVAPLIVAKSRELGIWERYGLNMDLDFRYAGRETLDDLYQPASRTDFAVASDVALCVFLGGGKQNPQEELQVIPFVHIKDHLKIVVRRKKQPPESPELEYGNISQLTSKKIGYHPGSVHDDFLSELKIFEQAQMVPMRSVLDCYRGLSSNQVEAVVLWEPHYHAFEKFQDVGIINNVEDSPYEWFLCLTATKKYLREHEHIARKILPAVKDAAAYCRIDGNKSKVISGCAAFLNTEFTGLDQKGLEDLFTKQPLGFGVNEVLPAFKDKLGRLIAKGGDIAKGANALTHSLWKGIDS